MPGKQHLDGHDVVLQRSKVTQPNFVMKVRPPNHHHHHHGRPCRLSPARLCSFLPAVCLIGNWQSLWNTSTLLVSHFWQGTKAAVLFFVIIIWLRNRHDLAVGMTLLDDCLNLNCGYPVQLGRLTAKGCRSTSSRLSTEIFTLPSPS